MITERQYLYEVSMRTKEGWADCEQVGTSMHDVAAKLHAKFDNIVYRNKRVLPKAGGIGTESEGQMSEGTVDALKAFRTKDDKKTAPKKDAAKPSEKAQEEKTVKTSTKKKAVKKAAPKSGERKPVERKEESKKVENFSAKLPATFEKEFKGKKFEIHRSGENRWQVNGKPVGGIREAMNHVLEATIGKNNGRHVFSFFNCALVEKAEKETK